MSAVPDKENLHHGVDSLRVARRFLYRALKELDKEIERAGLYDHAWVAEGHVTDALNSLRLYLRERR